MWHDESAMVFQAVIAPAGPAGFVDHVLPLDILAVYAIPGISKQSVDCA